MVSGRHGLDALCAVVCAGSLAACTSGGAASSESRATTPAWHYVSRPDLTPPVIKVDRADAAEGSAVSDGYVFLGTKGKVSVQGALVVDTDGQPVWISPQPHNTYNERVQEYAGEQVLTFWEGPVESGHGFGDVTLLDSSYEEVATVTTGGDIGPHKADLHESAITGDGTMLLTSYVPAKADLSGVGGAEHGWVWDGVVQEVEIATGVVVFEWHSLEHVPVSETATKPKKGAGRSKDNPFDYFHINSIREDGDGSLLVGARNTSAVYKVGRADGDVVWTLGGSGSDFTMGPGARFAWQHDAQRQADGTITLFDDESTPAPLKHSRGLRLSLDMQAMTATLVTEYLPPDSKRLAQSQGGMQVLDDGNVLIGWGQEPQYSLYRGDGTLLWDADIGGGTCYRAFLGDWTGTPSDPPDLAVRTSGATTTAYVSWNGATEVESWRLLVGPDSSHLGVVGTVPKAGFETPIEVPGAGSLVKVEALDVSGKVLGSAETGS